MKPCKAQHLERANESGNILFLILIAVALFAFLSYAVSSSTRGTGGTGREENTSLRASQIIQYATFTEQAVLRMRFRDVQDFEFCFDHDGWGHNDYDHAGCLDVKNQVFSTHPDGGGVSWSKPPVGANDGSDWYIPANVCIAGLGKQTNDNCNADGTGFSEDIVLILPNVDQAVCIAINENLSIPNPGGLPPQVSGDIFAAGQPYFTGTFADGGVINSAGSDPAIIRGQQYGCVQGNGLPPAGTFHYYHVLLPR
ncbi:MAG: hypothetical protein KJ667_08815 [Alphaproteobacteria bacterium]|nr:hypothetical protein [Alphaproteobacteria bacterium]